MKEGGPLNKLNELEQALEESLNNIRCEYCPDNKATHFGNMHGCKQSFLCTACVLAIQSSWEYPEGEDECISCLNCEQDFMTESDFCTFVRL